MTERWDALLDGEGCPAQRTVDIVEVMNSESAYWLAQAEESYEEGDFEMDQSMIKKWQDAAIEQSKIGGAGWTAENTRNVLLAEIALQLATHNHWLEQIAGTLKSLDDNSIVTQKQ